MMAAIVKGAVRFPQPKGLSNGRARDQRQSIGSRAVYGSTDSDPKSPWYCWVPIFVAFAVLVLWCGFKIRLYCMLQHCRGALHTNTNICARPLQDQQVHYQQSLAVLRVPACCRRRSVVAVFVARKALRAEAHHTDRVLQINRSNVSRVSADGDHRLHRQRAGHSTLPSACGRLR
jgi:hypothetical protein